MPESLLTILKFCLLALTYLFLARVVRVVLSEMRAEKVPTEPVAVPVAAAVSSAPRPGTEADAKGPGLQVVVAGPYEGRRFALADEITVGRAPGCGIVLAEDTFVSQVHARVFRHGREIWVEDLGSTNGTVVNGARLDQATRVRPGDTIQFGETVTRVVK